MSDMVSHPPTFAPQRPGSNEDLIRSLRDEIARLRADAERMRDCLSWVRRFLPTDKPAVLEKVTAALAGDQQGVNK